MLAFYALEVEEVVLPRLINEERIDLTCADAATCRAPRHTELGANCTKPAARRPLGALECIELSDLF